MDLHVPQLDLSSAWMNAAGALGYAPTADMVVIEPVGAFVTNAVSLKARKAAESRALLEFPGGVLLHSGLPNPGLEKIIQKYGPRWQRSTLPIWVHLLGSSPEEVHSMARRLEYVEGVSALEVGMPPGADGSHCLEMVRAACGELPVAVHLPLSDAAAGWLSKLPETGASALVLGAPRGYLPNAQNRLVGGRIHGPGLLPQVLAALRRLVEFPLPLIAGAGIFSRADGEACLSAGAMAVQVDTALW